MASMKPEPAVDKGDSFRDLVARIRARRVLVAQAIAEGASDVVPDRPLTDAEREELGVDRYFGEEEDDFRDVTPVSED
jgi:hypothetical protein